MGKAINSIVNRNEDENDNKNVIRLETVDVLHPKGSRIRAVIKKKNRDPQFMVVFEIREVTYLYDNDKTSKGFEIVKEELMGLNLNGAIDPKVVESITRDYRTVKNDNNKTN